MHALRSRSLWRLIALAAVLISCRDENPLEPGAGFRRVSGRPSALTTGPLSFPQTTLTANGLIGVWGYGPEDVFAAGFVGMVSHYNGTTWSPMTTNTTDDFYHIHGTSSSDVFAVGSGIHHWDGSSWSEQTSPTGETLWGVWAASSNDVWATGTNGTLIHYNGTSWSSVNSGAAVHLYRVWGTASNDVFVVGGSGLILHYNGTSWSQMNSGTAGFLLSVWGTASNNVWAVGEGGTILHYDGTAWAAQASGTTTDLYNVWAYSPTRAYAVSITGEMLIYNGSTWSTMSSGTDGWWFEGVWGASANNVFAVAANGKVVHAYRPLASVSMSPSAAMKYAIGENQIFSAYGLDAEGELVEWSPSVTWASSDEAIATVNSGGIASTVGWGTTTVSATMAGIPGNATLTVTVPPVPIGWTTTTVSGAGMNDVWGSSGSDVYAVGNGGAIMHFNGSAWSGEFNGSTEALRGVRGHAGTVWAVGDNGTVLQRSGPSWSQVDGVPSGPNNNFTDVALLPSGGAMLLEAATGVWQFIGGWQNLVACQCNFLEAPDGFPVYTGVQYLLQENFGSGWAPEFPLGSNYSTIRNAWYGSASNIWLITDDLNAWYSSGGSYSVVSTGLSSGTLVDVSGTSAGDVFFVGAPNRILHRLGSTMTELTLPTTSTTVFKAVWVSHDRKIFVVGVDENTGDGVILVGGALAGVPAVPGLAAAPASGHVALSWDDQNNEDSYDIERSTMSATGVFGPFVELTSPAADAESHNDATAAAGTLYRYRVRGCNYAGCGAWSNSVGSTPIGNAEPIIPTNFDAFAVSTLIQAFWTDNAINETKYQAQRRTASAAGVWGAWTSMPDLAANAVTINDATVVPGTLYNYRIRACNSYGCSPWKISGKVRAYLALPDAPTNLVATPHPGGIGLQWTENATNESHYELQRRTKIDDVFGEWFSLAQLSEGTNVYDDLATLTTRSYRYRVRACNAAGCSAWAGPTTLKSPLP